MDEIVGTNWNCEPFKEPKYFIDDDGIKKYYYCQKHNCKSYSPPWGLKPSYEGPWTAYCLFCMNEFFMAHMKPMQILNYENKE